MAVRAWVCTGAPRNCQAWREEVVFAEQFVAEAPDLEVAGHDSWHGSISLRWVLIIPLSTVIVGDGRFISTSVAAPRDYPTRMSGPTWPSA